MNTQPISGPAPAAAVQADHPDASRFMRPPTEVFRESQLLYENIIARIAVAFTGLLLAGTAIPSFIGVSMPSQGIWIAALVGIELSLIGILFLRMTTVVTQDTLIIKYHPFPGRRIPIGSIQQAEAIEYNPLANGGWGWRISRRFHRVFNVSGNKGVYIRYGSRPSDRFLVGSRNHTAFAAALESVRESV